MKKIVGAFFLVLSLAAGVLGWNYYQETYVGTTYYTIIPEGLEKQDIKAMDGQIMGQGYIYKLTAINDAGQEKEVEFHVFTDGDYRQGDGYPAGTYLKVTASKKRVISQVIVVKDQVPANVLALL